MRKRVLAMVFILGLVVGPFTISCSEVGGLTNASCGDGVVQAGEQCDDGNATSGDGCSSSCASEGALPPPGSPQASPNPSDGPALSEGSGSEP